MKHFTVFSYKVDSEFIEGKMTGSKRAWNMVNSVRRWGREEGDHQHIHKQNRNLRRAMPYQLASIKAYISRDFSARRWNCTLKSADWLQGEEIPPIVVSLCKGYLCIQILFSFSAPGSIQGYAAPQGLSTDSEGRFHEHWECSGQNQAQRQCLHFIPHMGHTSCGEDGIDLALMTFSLNGKVKSSVFEYLPFITCANR